MEVHVPDTVASAMLSLSANRGMWIYRFTVLVAAVLRFAMEEGLTGEIVGGAVGGIVSAFIVSLLVWLWRRASPFRAYDVTYLGSESPDFPPARIREHRWTKAQSYSSRNREVSVRLRAKATHEVRIDEANVRLVERVRRWPRPTWRGKTSAQGTYMNNLNDAGWSTQAGRPKPTSEPDGAQGWRLRFPGGLHLIEGDSLWLEATITVQDNWDGYVEFMGPSADGRRCYKRRQLTLNESTSDTVARLKLTSSHSYRTVPSIQAPHDG